MAERKLVGEAAVKWGRGSNKISFVYLVEAKVGCWLFPKDVTDTEPTDSPAQTAQVLQELEERYYDYDMYQLPPFPFATHRHFKTSDALPRNNEDWFAYLQKSLIFPITARYEEGNFLKYQAEVSITSLGELTDRYGVFATGRQRNGDHFNAPLADFEGIDDRKKSTKQLEWYRIWFANR